MRNVPFNQPMSEYEFEKIVPVDIREALCELWEEDEQGNEFAILDGIKFTSKEYYIGHEHCIEYSLNKIK
jgi:hypothetical protein